FLHTGASTTEFRTLSLHDALPICGAGSFWDPHHLKRNNEAIRLEPGRYFTDAISEEAIHQLDRHHAQNPDKPFFQYVAYTAPHRSEEHTSELQSRENLVCRLLLEK